MSKHLLRTGAIATLAAAALVLSACAPAAPGPGPGPDDPAAEPRAGGDLVLARMDDITTLMPTATSLNADIWSLQLILETLVTPSEDGTEIRPLLAEKWEQSEDGLSWTFFLREGVTFSNGDPLTSADVKFSIEQASAPEIAFAYINDPITSIETPDDLTVVLHTAEPWAPTLAAMALYTNSIIPADYAGMSAADYARAPIGTGPFVFDSWQQGVSLKLAKNENYWRENRPYLDSVTFMVVADENTRALQLQGGAIHVNEGVSYSSVSQLSAQAGIELGEFPSSRVDFLNFNHGVAPFDDPHVRRAIAHAIDRKAIAEAVLYGVGEPAESFLSPSLWAHNPATGALDYDLDAAKAEMAKSTVPDGFSTTLVSFAGNGTIEATAQVVQAALAELNIDVKIQSLDFGSAVDTIINGNYELAFIWATSDTVDPDQMSRYLATIDGGSFSNFSWFENTEIEELAGQAARATAQEDRQQFYDKIQAIYNAELPALPLYYSPSLFSHSPSVRDFSVLPTGNYQLADTWLVTD